MSVLRFAVPDFSKRRTARGIVDDDGKTSRLFQQLNDWNVTPGQDHGDQKFSTLVIN
jgi:hypothetical protein